jgi:hypothetical protein
MEGITLTCENCGEQTIRPSKPEPQNAREGKQVLFHCEYCGAVNLRDGSIRTRKAPEPQVLPDKSQVTPKEKEKWFSIGQTIVTFALGVLALIFLRKGIKGPGDSPRDTSGGPGQSYKTPWSSIR